MTPDYMPREYTTAAVSVRKAMLDSISLEECSHSFSKRFESNMKKIIQRRRRNIFVKQIGKIAASLLLIAMVGFACVLGINTEARASVVTWFKEICESSIFEKENRLPKYEVNWLPDELELVDIEDNSTAVFKRYENGQKSLLFSYYILDGEMYQDLLLHSDFFINGCPADFIKKGTENGLIWIDENRKTVFELSGQFCFETLVIIAKSIQ